MITRHPADRAVDRSRIPCRNNPPVRRRLASTPLLRTRLTLRRPPADLCWLLLLAALAASLVRQWLGVREARMLKRRVAGAEAQCAVEAGSVAWWQHARSAAVKALSAKLKAAKQELKEERANATAGAKQEAARTRSDWKAQLDRIAAERSAERAQLALVQREVLAAREELGRVKEESSKGTAKLQRSNQWSMNELAGV